MHFCIDWYLEHWKCLKERGINQKWISYGPLVFANSREKRFQLSDCPADIYLDWPERKKYNWPVHPATVLVDRPAANEYVNRVLGLLTWVHDTVTNLSQWTRKFLITQICSISLSVGRYFGVFWGCIRGLVPPGWGANWQIKFWRLSWERAHPKAANLKRSE